MPANLENSALTRPQDWKRSVFIPIPKKGNAKEFSNYHILAVISHATKVMLRILQARLQQYVNQKLPDGFQAGFRKGRGAREQISNMLDHRKSKRVPEKNLLLLYWLHQSLWLWITTNWKILREMGISGPPYLPPEKPECRLRSNS